MLECFCTLVPFPLKAGSTPHTFESLKCLTQRKREGLINSHGLTNFSLTRCGTMQLLDAGRTQHKYHLWEGVDLAPRNFWHLRLFIFVLGKEKFYGGQAHWVVNRSSGEWDMKAEVISVGGIWVDIFVGLVFWRKDRDIVCTCRHQQQQQKMCLGPLLVTSRLKKMWKENKTLEHIIFLQCHIFKGKRYENSTHFGQFFFFGSRSIFFAPA